MSEVGKGENIATLVTTRPESEIALDLKRRAAEALEPLARLMDEAAANGLQITWDNFFVGPPLMRFHVNNLRVVKNY